MSWAQIDYKIGGPACYLSHAQTAAVIRRACIRGGFNLKYSQGFNPHPRMSLVLPRPVGVESDDETALVGVEAEAEAFNTINAADALSKQLPDGFELKSITVSAHKPRIQATGAMLVFELKSEAATRADAAAKKLKSAESITAQRRKKPQAAAKTVDIKSMLSGVAAVDNRIEVGIIISPKGAPRVEEVMEALDITQDDLESVPLRTRVKWEKINFTTE